MRSICLSVLTLSVVMFFQVTTHAQTYSTQYEMNNAPSGASGVIDANGADLNGNGILSTGSGGATNAGFAHTGGVFHFQDTTSSGQLAYFFNQAVAGSITYTLDMRIRAVDTINGSAAGNADSMGFNSGNNLGRGLRLIRTGACSTGSVQWNAASDGTEHCYNFTCFRRLRVAVDGTAAGGSRLKLYDLDTGTLIATAATEGSSGFGSEIANGGFSIGSLSGGTTIPTAYDVDWVRIVLGQAIQNGTTVVSTLGGTLVAPAVTYSENFTAAAYATGATLVDNPGDGNQFNDNGWIGDRTSSIRSDSVDGKTVMVQGNNQTSFQVASHAVTSATAVCSAGGYVSVKFKGGGIAGDVAAGTGLLWKVAAKNGFPGALLVPGQTDANSPGSSELAYFQGGGTTCQGGVGGTTTETQSWTSNSSMSDTLEMRIRPAAASQTVSFYRNGVPFTTNGTISYPCGLPAVGMGDVVVTNIEIQHLTASAGAGDRMHLDDFVVQTYAAEITRTAGSNPSCSGSAITLDAGAGYASYSWSPGGATTQSITVSPTSTTNYTVTVTTAAGCNGTSDTYTQTVNALPANPGALTAPAAVCASSTGNTASVVAQGGITHVWSISNGTITSSTTGDSITFTAGASGTTGLTVQSRDNTTLCLSSGTSSASVTIVQAATATDKQIVISQVYGGGGNSGAPYTNDYIELFNKGTTSVSLSGWTVQYASPTGTTWQTTALSGTLAPVHYYLIQEALGGANGVALPTADATGTIPMALDKAKAALVKDSSVLTGSGCPFRCDVVDFVGYGTGSGGADCFEGSAAAPTISNTLADFRTPSCRDTDNNATTGSGGDFATGAPNPRNSSNTNPQITVQPGNQSVCALGIATMSVTATGDGLAYQWRIGTTNLTNGVNGNGTTVSGATLATLTLTNVHIADAATNYNVVVTAGSCPSMSPNSVTSNNATLTVQASPTASAGGPYTMCASDASVAVSGSASNQSSVQWISSGTGTFGNAAALSTTYTPSGAERTAGSVQLTLRANAISPCTGFTDSAPVTLTINANPTCTITGPGTVCGGSTTGFSAPAAMDVYSWSVTGNGSIVGANNQQSVSVLAAGSGSFTVQLTITKTGCSSNCSQPVTIDPVDPPTAICQNVTAPLVAGSVTVNATQVNNGSTADASCTQTITAYEIAKGSVSCASISFVPSVTFDCTELGGNTVTLRVTQSDGQKSCCTATVSVTNADPVITQGAGPLALTVATGSTCPGAANSVSLSATDGNNDTLTWTVSGPPSAGSASITGSPGNAVTVCYQPSGGPGSDSFIVQVNDGCGGLDTITINVTIANPPTMTSMKSVRLHGSTTELSIELIGGGMSEPRRSGIQKLVFTFNELVECATHGGVPNSGDFGVSAVPSMSMPSPASIGFVGGGSSGTQLVVTYNAGDLPDLHAYTLSLANKFKSQATGLVLGGTPSVTVRGMEGDVTFNGMVTNVGDVAQTKDKNGLKLVNSSLNDTTCQYDVNTDGSVNLIDVAYVKTKLTP